MHARADEVWPSGGVAQANAQGVAQGIAHSAAHPGQGAAGQGDEPTDSSTNKPAKVLPPIAYWRGPITDDTRLTQPLNYPPGHPGLLYQPLTSGQTVLTVLFVLGSILLLIAMLLAAARE